MHMKMTFECDLCVAEYAGIRLKSENLQRSEIRVEIFPNQISPVVDAADNIDFHFYFIFRMSVEPATASTFSNARGLFLNDWFYARLPLCFLIWNEKIYCTYAFILEVYCREGLMKISAAVKKL